MLFHPANISYWCFLGIGIFLFLLVIVSGGGDDDVEVETDVDSSILEFDTDVEIDADADVDAEGEFSPLQILGWLGIGRAPLILLLAIDFSSWGVTGWMLNVGWGNLTGKIPERFWGWGGVIFIISLSISLFIGSLIAHPLGKIFAPFGEDTSSSRLIGCVGNVTSKKLPYLREGKIGQADVLDAARNIVTVSVSLPDWATVIPVRGQEILIIDQTEHSYLAIAKDSSDRDRWLNGINKNQDKI